MFEMVRDPTRQGSKLSPDVLHRSLTKKVPPWLWIYHPFIYHTCQVIAIF